MGYKPDETDLKILSVLKENSDYSIRQIADKTLLPVTTIHNRISRMKSAGTIRRFTVDIDPESVGKGFMVYLLISANLEILKAKNKTQYDLAKEIKRFPFTERVDIVAGGTDLVAIIRVKDVGEYDKVLLSKIQMLEGIKNTQSLIVLHKE
jgi:DNA-binding Lrp family transcriptional regulator